MWTAVPVDVLHELRCVGSLCLIPNYLMWLILPSTSLYQQFKGHTICTLCRDSLLYKGSEDDDGLGVEVTG